MGNPLSPIVADILMDNFLDDFKPMNVTKYVDDNILYLKN